MTQLIGARLKALREERKLSQDDLARVFGFKDRQTVSAIETGERRLSAEELLTAVEKLGASLDYFTNPFLLAGEGKFSWRQSNVAPERLNGFERRSGRWIAALRVLAPQVGKPASYLRQSLKLTSKSRFEDAMEAGERFAADFELGPVPAKRLVDVMERKLGVLVLMVDAIDGVSGAACRLPDLDSVLINRHEVVGRRSFDLAHELFHILTWDTMPPAHVEESTEQSRNRVEQLANNFASALLMPTNVLDRFGPWSGGAEDSLIPAQEAEKEALILRSAAREGRASRRMATGAPLAILRDTRADALAPQDEGSVTLVRRLNETADALQVTATALKWRLVAIGRLDPDAARSIPDAALRFNGHEAPAGEPPPLFSRPFVEVIALAINEGRLSARRAADLLDMTTDDFADLCTTHGVEAPAEL